MTRALLADIVAVVSGANRGIGRQIAETFSAHGAKVFACCRASDSATAGWATERSIRLVTLDLADENSIRQAVKDIRSESAGVDVLVNNAGTAHGALFQMTSMADLRRVFEVNFFGQIAFSQNVIRLMAKRGGGSVINISSSTAERADPGTFAYGASKAAFERATLSMARELGAHSIRVNAIAPGVTETAMLDQMDPAARQSLIEAAAMKRPATPQNIADTALFLASELSAHITGQVIHVDGGLL